MRGVGAVLSAAVTTVVVVALAGCGGGDGGGGERAVTVTSVKEDVRAAVAAGGLERRPVFTDEKSRLLDGRPCQVAGEVGTGTAPDRKAADRLVAEMKDRGWKATEPFPDRRAVLWALDRDDWTVTVVSGEASPEEMASGMLSGAVPGKEDGFKGVMFYGFGRGCGRGTATPTP
ncbi:hypothetical protein ACWD5F_12015 [Streptomyces sp. NPDC002499]